MKISTLLFFILVLYSCRQSSQSKLSTTSDSVLTYLRTTVNPLFQEDDKERPTKILDSLKPIIDDLDNYKLTCTWLRFKSVLKESENQFDSSVFFAEESLRIAKEKDTTEKDILGAYIQLSSVLPEEKKYMEALQYGNSAYYLAKKVDTLALPLICDRLSHIYSSLNDPVMNKRFLFEGYKRSVKPIHKIEFANNIARYYEEMGAYDSAILFFKTVLKDTTIKSLQFDAVKYENLGINLTRVKKYDEGLRYQLKAAAINRQLGGIDAQSYFNLASTYVNLRQYNVSEKLLDSALNLAKEDKDWNLIKRIWHSKADILDKQNQPGAYAAMDSAYSYFEVENNSSLAEQARELDTKYSVRDKDNQIHLLAVTNEASLKIRNQQRVIIFVISIGIFLLALSGSLLWRRRQTKMLLRETNLRQQLLRAQIDPHFYSNAFGIVPDLIRAGEIEKSIAYLKSLIKVMRFNFENAGENLISLKSEIAYLDGYLNLQKMFRPGLFDYQIQVYDNYEDEDVFILAMLFQPLVENSILHGFPQLPYQGMIDIKIERRANSLYCTIDDNGKGFQHLYDIMKTNSTKINKERLAIFSKQTMLPATLTIIDKKTQGASNGVHVEIEIPISLFKTNVS